MIERGNETRGRRELNIKISAGGIFLVWRIFREHFECGDQKVTLPAKSYLSAAKSTAIREVGALSAGPAPV